MGFRYFEHAENNLADRNIPKKLVQNAILNPDIVLEAKKGRKIAQKLVGNKLLRVIYNSHGKTYIVVTAYYTNPARYLRK